MTPLLVSMVSISSYASPAPVDVLPREKVRLTRIYLFVLTYSCCRDLLCVCMYTKTHCIAFVLALFFSVRQSRVGYNHKVTKEDSIKWFQDKFEGVVLAKAV